MKNSKLVSRSQVLLQYLLAVDTAMDSDAAVELSTKASEVRGPGEDPECLA